VLDEVLRLLQSSAQSLWIAVQLLGLSALLFGFLALLVKGAEAVAAGRRALGELRVNLSLYCLDALLVGPALAVLVSVIRHGVTRYSLELIDSGTWLRWGSGATLMAVVFVGDFISYWRHRLEHTCWLWPAHAIHHSDTEVTWLTLLRFHPINRVTTQCIDIGGLALLGFPDWALVVYVMLRHYYGEFIHADLPWMYGPLKNVFVSPVMHRWHHARDVTGAGSNFATIFSTFDLAFGTYYVPGLCNVPLGVSDDLGSGTIGQLLYPFRVWASSSWWASTTIVFALGAALSSGGAPFIAAIGGAFRPSDFASNIAGAREIAAGRDPYQADFAPLHAAVLGIPSSKGRPFFPHPPLAAVLIRPFAPLSFAAAAAVWFGLSIGLLLGLAVLLAEIVGKPRNRDRAPSGAVVAMLYLGLLVWPPVLCNLEKGQWSILLAFMIALTWRSFDRGHPAEAGAWAGAAAAVKVFPALLAPYLLLRGRRATIAFTIAAAIGTLAALLWTGPSALTGFLRHSRANLPYWETWIATGYSLDGAAARLFIGGTWARPLLHAPLVARALVAIATLTLVMTAAWATGRDPATGEREGARFAAFATLLVVLNPLAMGHNGVLLALPIALVWRALVVTPRIGLRAAWAAAVVLVSIPKETVFRLCPVPVDPARGLAIVALPCWGAILLFFVAIITAVGSPVASEIRRPGLRDSNSGAGTTE
jgi:sterol desaturase/sphingolipid hydroxylase (fatty acid hydroxylase superfamily)